MMSLQNLVVAVLVLASTAYAAWTLMPSVWRRALAGRLLRLAPWPPVLADRLRLASQAASGCGCDGCDHAPAKTKAKAKAKAGAASGAGAGAVNAPAGAPRPAVTAQPITFHPRTRH